MYYFYFYKAVSQQHCKGKAFFETGKWFLRFSYVL